MCSKGHSKYPWCTQICHRMHIINFLVHQGLAGLYSSLSANIELAPALANAQANASKQTPQLSPRAALSALCLSCRGISGQILNVVQIQGFECKFWRHILNIEYFWGFNTNQPGISVEPARMSTPAGFGDFSVEPKCKTTFDIGYEKRESLVHRTATTSYPCYGQVLGEFGGSWSCTTFPTANIVIFYFSAKITVNYSDFFLKK